MAEQPRYTNAKLAPENNQLGVLILDGSSSMNQPADGNISKAHEVDEAVRGVFTRFRNSRSAKNFSFAVVTFDEEAQTHLPITPAPMLEDSVSYNPLQNHGGATNIGQGLLEAKRIADEFLRKAPQDVDSSVVLVVMSDGRDGEGGVADPADTVKIAQEIKKDRRFQICSTYFAATGSDDPQAEQHLQTLVGNGGSYKTVHDAESLRAFFIHSLSQTAR